jgi:hypothetical protein
MRRIRATIVVLTLLVLVPSVASAQATITGVVKDAGLGSLPSLEGRTDLAAAQLRAAATPPEAERSVQLLSFDGCRRIWRAGTSSTQRPANPSLRGGDPHAFDRRDRSIHTDRERQRHIDGSSASRTRDRGAGPRLLRQHGMTPGEHAAIACG